MITDIFNKDIVKVLTFFSVSPGSKLTRNEIKEKTFLNNVPLDNALNVLLSNEILIKEKRLLSLNFESEYMKKTLDLIRREHLRFKEIPLNIYYAILDFSNKLSDMGGIAQAYLFGSYAKLIYTEKSDIDLAVFLEKENKKIIKKIKEVAGKIERRYGKSMELHFFEKKDMKQKDPIIKEILRNGISCFDQEHIIGN